MFVCTEKLAIDVLKHKLYFPYITTHMLSTSSLLKDVFVAINVEPDLLGQVWSGPQMFVRKLATDVSKCLFPLYNNP